MAWTSKIINVTEIKKQCIACSGTQWSSYEVYGKISRERGNGIEEDIGETKRRENWNYNKGKLRTVRFLENF